MTRQGRGLARLSGLALWFSVCLVCRQGFAQVAQGPRATHADVADVLAEDERQTTRWWRSWLAAQSLLIGAQLAAAAIRFDDEAARAEHFLNAGAASTGLIALLIVRPKVLGATETLAAMPEDTEAARAEKRRHRHQMLHRAAADEAFATSVLPFVGGTVVGAAVGLPLWLKYDRPVPAALSFSGSLLVTALQVYTRPTLALDAERAGARQLSVLPLFLSRAAGAQVSSSW